MNIPQDVLAHKTMMIALLAVAGEVADELGLQRDLSVTEMARQLEASRTSVYEQKERLSRSLATLLEVRPGRPRAKSDESREPSLEALRLECRVQRFRLEHPDAIVAHPTRSGYSPSFRRFILGELDAWQGCRATFAEASGVPLDTLSDWVRADSVGLTPTAPIKKHTEVPVDASAMAREIVEQFEKWEGSTRSFVGFAREHFGLTNSQVVKVLRICGAITTRSRRPFRYRGSTDNVSPGALFGDRRQDFGYSAYGIREATTPELAGYRRSSNRM